MISIDDKTGSLVIQNSDNYSFAAQIWTVEVTAESPASEQTTKSTSIQFLIEWIDPCSNAELLPAFFIDTPLTVELYSELTLTYSSMLHMADIDCGGYTNQFKYIDGPALDASEPYGADMSQFTFSEEFEGEFTF